MGVDPKADEQFALTPYHQSANNPVMFVDPDGRIFFLAAGIILAAAKIKVAIGVKIAIGAIASMVANRDKIAAAANGSRNSFWKGLGTAIGYGAVGAAGAAIGLNAGGAAGFMFGGTLNVMFEGATGQFDKEGVHTGGRMLGSFLTGGFSALAGKNFGDVFAKGASLADKKAGITAAKNKGDLLFRDPNDPVLQAGGSADKYFAKMEAKKSIFSWRNLGQYSLKGAENVGAKLNENNGQMSWKSFAGYFTSGFVGGLASFSANKGLSSLFSRNLGWYKSGSIVSPLFAYGAGDFSHNVLNYMTKEDGLAFSWSKVYSNGFKSIFKIDFFTGGSSIGFNTFNNIYNR